MKVHARVHMIHAYCHCTYSTIIQNGQSWIMLSKLGHSRGSLAPVAIAQTRRDGLGSNQRLTTEGTPSQSPGACSGKAFIGM
jgi:hypothetical protein